MAEAASKLMGLSQNDFLGELFFFLHQSNSSPGIELPYLLSLLFSFRLFPP